MYELVFIVVIVSSIWVLFDAHTNQIIRDGEKPYKFFTNGAFIWFIGSLFLWILNFPIYLMFRKKYLALKYLQQSQSAAPVIYANTTMSGNVMQYENADEIRKYKKLLEDGIITEEDFENKKKQLMGL